MERFKSLGWIKKLSDYIKTSSEGNKRQEEEALLLLSLGYSYIENNWHSNAIEQFEKFLKIVKDDNKHKTEAMIGLGKAYKETNKSERAMEYFKAASEIAKKQGDANGEEEARNLISKLVFRGGVYPGPIIRE